VVTVTTDYKSSGQQAVGSDSQHLEAAHTGLCSSLRIPRPRNPDLAGKREFYLVTYTGLACSNQTDRKGSAAVLQRDSIFFVPFSLRRRKI
jgi:hypothetical protein